MNKDWKYYPGSNWKNNRLIEYLPSEIRVYRPWGPKAGAWAKTGDQDWTGFKPFNFPLTNPFPMYTPSLNLAPGDRLLAQERARQQAYLINPPGASPPVKTRLSPRIFSWYEQLKKWEARHSFRSAIPPWALTRAEQLRQRQWHMLQFFNRVPGAADLFDSTPALAFLLADCRALRKISNPLRAARSLILKKQRHIAGWLGFPATDSTVRILRRVWPGGLHLQLLRQLRDILKLPGAERRLAHAGGSLYSVLCVHWTGMNIDLALRIAGTGEERINDVKLMWGSCLSMLRDMGVAEECGPLSGISTVNQLKKFMHYTREQYEHELNANKPFPVPPLEGTGQIIPITDSASLKAEADDMKNCIFGYRYRILRGEYYAYRMASPERCCIGIVRDGQGWKVDAVKLKRNGVPKNKTIEQVLKWAAENGGTAERESVDWAGRHCRAGEDNPPF